MIQFTTDGSVQSGETVNMTSSLMLSQGDRCINVMLFESKEIRERRYDMIDTTGVTDA